MSEMPIKCESIREEFSALLDDELTSDERARVEEHLAGCAECLRALNRFKRVDDVYSRLAPVPAPAGFEESVRKSLVPGNVRRFPFRAVMGTLLAAAAVLVVVTVLPRTAEAPDDGSFQISKMAETAETAAPQANPAPMEAPAAPVISMDADVGLKDLGEDQEQSTAVGASGDEAARSFDAIQPEQPENERPQRQQAAEGEESDVIEFRRRDVAIAGGAESLGSREEAPVPYDSERMDLRKSESAEPTTLEDPKPEILAQDFQRADQPEERLNELQSESAAEATAEADGNAQLPARAKEGPELAANAPTGSVQRTFDIREGVWYQSGYAGEDVRELERDGEALQALIKADPTVGELLSNDSRLVFQVDGVWYALSAVE